MKIQATFTGTVRDGTRTYDAEVELDLTYPSTVEGARAALHALATANTETRLTLEAFLAAKGATP